MLRRRREPVRRLPRSRVETTVVLVLLTVVRGLRNVPDVLSVDVVTVLVPPVRFDPVRPDTERRAVFRSTTREADEVFGSILILFLPVERSLAAICLVRPPGAFPPTSITFTRDLPASVFDRVVFFVSRFEARP